MNRILTVLRTALHWITTPIRLVRQGDADLAGTYPGRYGRDATDVVRQGSVTSGLMFPGGNGGGLGM